MKNVKIETKHNKFSDIFDKLECPDTDHLTVYAKAYIGNILMNLTVFNTGDVEKIKFECTEDNKVDTYSTPNGTVINVHECSGYYRVRIYVKGKEVHTQASDVYFKIKPVMNVFSIYTLIDCILEMNVTAIPLKQQYTDEQKLALAFDSLQQNVEKHGLDKGLKDVCTRYITKTFSSSEE